MRLTSLSLGALTLLLLIAVPVNAAPALHTGSQTSYNLSVSVSLLQSCAPILGSTMSAMHFTIMRQPLHTMWWVNGALRVNDTVPVLVFPTNVTSSTSLDLGGSIGTRSAWTLAFPKTGSLLPPDPLATMTSSIP